MLNRWARRVLFVAVLVFMASAGIGLAAVHGDYRLRVAGEWTGVDRADEGAALHFEHVRRARATSLTARWAAAAALAAAAVLLGRRRGFLAWGWGAIPLAVAGLFALPAVAVAALAFAVAGSYRCADQSVGWAGFQPRAGSCLRHTAPSAEDWLNGHLAFAATGLGGLVFQALVAMALGWIALVIWRVVSKPRPGRTPDAAASAPGGARVGV